MLNDARVPSSRVPIVANDQTGTTTREWFRFFDALSALLAFGRARFSDSTSPVFVANTPRLLPIGQTTFNQGMSVAASRVTVATPGTYTLALTLQLANANASNADWFMVWMRINGVDQPSSAARAAVPVLSFGTLVTTFYADFAAGDYFELYGLSRLGYAVVSTTAASGVPAYPATPGLTLIATQIL